MPKIILNIQTDEDIITNGENIACYIVADKLSATKIKEIIATGKMVLASGEKALDICRQYNLDGIIKQVDITKPLKIQVKPLRETLKHKTLGVIIPARRHEAMLAGETEPDFIAFSSCETKQEAEIINWYNDLFLIPCAAVVSSPKSLSGAFDIDFMIINAENFKNFGC